MDSYNTRKNVLIGLHCVERDLVRRNHRAISRQNSHSLIASTGFCSVKGGVCEFDDLFRAN